ncbi:MAG: hypothetical protein ACYC0V_16220 [Armatimonadota bacterium]
MLKNAWRWFIAAPEFGAASRNVIAWWEIRRIPFNVIVGLGAITSFVLFLIFIGESGVLSPGEDAEEPMGLLFAAVMGPIILNICYTAGWIVELFLRKIGIWRPKFGPLLLIFGTLFTLLVVGIPAIYWGAECIRNGIALHDAKPGDMIGAYTVTHDGGYGVSLGTEMLILRADGTFKQMIIPTKGKRRISVGTWHLEPDPNYETVVLLVGRLEVLDENGEYQMLPQLASDEDRLRVDRRRNEVRIHVDVGFPSDSYKYVKTQ